MLPPKKCIALLVLPYTPYDRLTTLCLLTSHLLLVTLQALQAGCLCALRLTLSLLLSDRNSTTSPLRHSSVVLSLLPLSLRTLSLSPTSSTTPVCWPDGEAQIDSNPRPTRHTHRQLVHPTGIPTLAVTLRRYPTPAPSYSHTRPSGTPATYAHPFNQSAHQHRRLLRPLALA